MSSLALLHCAAEVREDLSVENLRAQTGTFPFDTVPSVALEDVNPKSTFYQQKKDAAAFQGTVTVWYFVHASCPYCRSQYELLDEMSADLLAQNKDHQFLAVNAVGHEASVAELAENGNAPILQDEADIDLWGLWQIDYRDVVVVNPDLIPIARINLTENDLNDAAVYDALQNLIIDVVLQPET